MTASNRSYPTTKSLLDAQRQHVRLLKPSFPQDSVPADSLLVSHQLATDILSGNPGIPRKDVMGKQVMLELRHLPQSSLATDESFVIHNDQTGEGVTDAQVRTNLPTAQTIKFVSL